MASPKEMIEARTKANRHEYNIHVPVYDPTQDGAGDEYTFHYVEIDFVGDDEALVNASQYLGSAIVEADPEENWATTEVERHICDNIDTLLQANVILDAECEGRGVTDVASFRSKLEDEDFSLYRL